MISVRLFTLLNPTIGIVFALVFLALWVSQRNRTYILAMSGAMFAYTCAVLGQIFAIPRDINLNAMVSCALYLLAIGLFVEASLMRVGVRGNLIMLGAISVIIFGLIFFFSYIDESIETRIYVLSIGAGVLFWFAAFRMRRATVKKPLDKLLFWLLLAIGLHFFPRTVLILEAAGPEGVSSIDGYGKSLYWSVLNFSLVLLSLLICLTMLLAIASDIMDDLRIDRNRDGMTPLLNRRGFEEQAQEQLLELHTATATLVFCDIDHFKSVNDEFGHAAGDEVIRLIGQRIGAATRRGDVAGRIGGEEFAVLLAHTNRASALATCERLRAQIEASRYAGMPKGRSVTASFGVAEVGQDEPLDELMRRADEMLYLAKRNGRNRVEG